MKEFLVKFDDGYKLVVCDKSNDGIEVPSGADSLATPQIGANEYFYKNDFNEFYSGLSKKWEICGVGKNNFHDVLWQREKVEVEVDNVSEKLSKVDETLKERQSQYGCFEDVAFVTQGFIEIMSKCKYKEMPQPHKVALYMIASKMARLVNGDCNHKDSWHDIGGYAKLIEDLIGDNS